MPEIKHLELSKVRIYNAPINPPGICAVCGSSNNEDRDFMDIGIDLEWYGTVYFCTFCLSEVMNHLGYLTPEQVSSLEDENNILRERVLELSLKEQAIEQFIGAARSSGIFDGFSGIPNYEPSFDEGLVENPEPNGEGKSDNSPGTSKSDKVAKSSASKQGPDRVSADGSDESNKFNFDL